MKIKECRTIYRQGREATVKFIVDQDVRYQKLASPVEKLGKKITVLEKNSHTSSKRASSDDITKKTKPNKNKNNEPRKKEGQEGHPKHERITFETYEIDKFIEYELKSHILPVLFGLGLVKGTSNNPRIQLVSATPYGSEPIGFSTKYKTTVRIST